MITTSPAPASRLEPTATTGASADPTHIGYLSVGAGPGLVVLHGAMQSATSQLDLARLLAPFHEVHLMDRRGRGLSGPYPKHATTTTDINDLAMVLRATGARDVLGVSSGALIAARAAIILPEIERLALFEPPLVVDASLSLDFVKRYERELARGDLHAVMVTAMLGAQIAPGFMRILPRPLLRAMTRRMLASDDARSLGPGEVHFRDIVQTLGHDFRIVAEQAETIDDFASIRARTLLLTGAKSAPYLRKAVFALATVLPNASTVELPDLGHGATQNRVDSGHPEAVAPALETFFA